MIDVKIIEGDNIRSLESELSTYLSRGYEIESMGSAVLMLEQGSDSKGRPRPPQPIIIWQYVLVRGRNDRKRSGE